MKYAVTLAVGDALYWWRGWEAVLWALGISVVAALAMHFFFRWKSNGWIDDYGPYKSLFK